jgi:translation elongation factor EF-Tu-like GTPase
MKKAQKHFTAMLTFRSTENGGLTSPVSSGYRPTVKFPFSEENFIAVADFEEPELVFPGEIVTADISLLRADDYLKQIYEGQDFEMYEGEDHVGHDTVTEIL